MTTSLARLALGDLDHELTLTRRTLERVPDEHLDWRPHEKSSTLGALAGHLAGIPFYGSMILALDGFDVTKPMPKQDKPRGRDEMLQTFDRLGDALRTALDEASEDTLSESWTMRAGDHVIMQLPRAAAVRRLAISHLVHHRAQLGVYLRLLGLPVPSVYGPSADER